MNMEEKDMELIEQYLEGTLPEEARMNFERRMKEEPAFKQAVLEMAELIEGIRHQGRMEILGNLRDLENEISSDNIRHISPGGVKWMRPALRVAVVALLLIAGVWTIRLLNKPGMEEQLAALYEPLPKQLLHSTVRGEQENLDELKKSAAEAYGARKYREAAALLEQLIYEKQDTTTLTQLFYTNALLQNGDAACNEDLEKLRTIEEQASHRRKMHLARIDLAIKYMQCGKKEEVSGLLKEVIVNGTPDLQEKASTLRDLSNSK